MGRKIFKHPTVLADVSRQVLLACYYIVHIPSKIGGLRIDLLQGRLLALQLFPKLKHKVPTVGLRPAADHTKFVLLLPIVGDPAAIPRAISASLH